MKIAKLFGDRIGSIIMGIALIVAVAGHYGSFLIFLLALLLSYSIEIEVRHK